MRQTASLYCLSNPYMPGLVKIGFTRRSVYTRMSELSFGGWGTSATGVPGAFALVKAWEVDAERVEAIERQVHDALRAHRVKAHRGRRAREFFHLQPHEAVDRVAAILAGLQPAALRRPSPAVAAAPLPRAPYLPAGWPPRPAPARNPHLGAFLLVMLVVLVSYFLIP